MSFFNPSGLHLLCKNILCNKRFGSELLLSHNRSMRYLSSTVNRTAVTAVLLTSSLNCC